MNKSEIKTFDEMKNMVEGIANTVKDISICLRGDPKNHKDEGLVGAVNNNVKWKDKVNKSLGTLGLGFFALVIKEGWQHLIKRGG